MKVRAKENGYYNGKRVRPGQVFDLLPGHKPGAWMEPLDKPAAPKPAEPAPPVTMAAINKQQIAEQDAQIKRKGG